MSWYMCDVCHSFEYDDEVGSVEGGIPAGVSPEALGNDWTCPVCMSDRTHLKKKPGAATKEVSTPPVEADPATHICRAPDYIEPHFVQIKTMAQTGQPVIEPMRTARLMVTWDEILIIAAALRRLPLNTDEAVNMETVIGPDAKQPMVLSIPFYVTHMSFGALSREIKIALAMGSARAETACCSGEGGILPAEFEQSHRYIFEYVPNRYSATPEYMQAADAIEIKISQSAKPGMGGFLPGAKVTEEIAKIRGFPQGHDIHSPARFDDIRSPEDLIVKVGDLRDLSGGRPVGIKFAAGDIEGDLEVAIAADPDFITIDGRPGSTAAAPKAVKDATAVPTMYALDRARRYMDDHGVRGISLVMTGGFRISADIAKGLALGADAIALGTAPLIAAGCDQYRICHTGDCPTGVTTQDPVLRARVDTAHAADGVARFFAATRAEIEYFSRLCGHHDVHDLSVHDLCTVNSEISEYTRIRHV
ncbi:glutamate synthase-related protein [Methanogenium marinum]|uniref:Archaeal glutamate synthase [NADPH] n=1 Tax=Methanogenium marinum TaxID=348610 RepID=A0A9Q4KTR8_9EURY|nr:glutamate synthase-related protein [Methanogenium marinum]MDE4908474.1 glutamate synthase-related protein [Methanogenium marinum]